MPIVKSKPALTGDCGEPLLPDTVDLRSLCWMKLDMCRLQGSDFRHLADNEEFGAAVKLWMASMHQVPAGSLPNNDRIIASLAGYANVPRRWNKVRDMALYGWIPCNDDRLYHPVISEMVLEVQGSKGGVQHALRDGKEDAAAERRRKNRERVKRWRKARAEAAEQATASGQAAGVDAQSKQSVPAVRPTVTPGVRSDVMRVMPDVTPDVTRYNVTNGVTVMRYSNAVISDKIQIKIERENIYNQAVTPKGVTALQRNAAVTRDVMRNEAPDVTRYTGTADTPNLPEDAVQSSTKVPENNPLPPETDLPFQDEYAQDGVITDCEPVSEIPWNETESCTALMPPESVLENHHDAVGEPSVQVDEKNFFQSENSFENSAQEVVQETVPENLPEPMGDTELPSSDVEPSDEQDSLWDLFIKDGQTVALDDGDVSLAGSADHEPFEGAATDSIPAAEDEAPWGREDNEEMSPGDEEAARALFESMKRAGLPIDQDEDDDAAAEAPVDAQDPETDAAAPTPNTRLERAVHEALGDGTEKKVLAQETVPEASTSGEAAADADQSALPARAAKNGARFAEFWAAYPKRVARKVCEKKWKARKLDEKADVILADIAERLKKDYRWLDGYIPNPETYLNGNRWEDDILPESERPGHKNGSSSASIDAQRQKEDAALRQIYGKDADPAFLNGLSEVSRRNAVNMVEWMRSKGAKTPVDG
ncbi:YdaU family protein [Acidithiobacillus thiooxidans]|uniref:DUF1376 domain-containing protein n=1 Tax=Acidithiobacillus thiooxidans TaxID=930 RepID=UPI001C06D66B|nr:DUF1376 domain-containing protein [Acidithiobacillus thiooxidans]MBU2835277.1 YdaU family protein [Acidithiobacillus thiooxidans]